MSIVIESNNDFLEKIHSYVKENPFTSDTVPNFEKLSDVYAFFYQNKDNLFSPEVYEALKKLINEKFGIDASALFDYDENLESYKIEPTLKSLNETIKDRFLEHYTDKNVDKKELLKLSAIVNKTHPEVFLKLIKNPDKSQSIEQFKFLFLDELNKTIEISQAHYSAESLAETRDIAAALYISMQEHAPYLNGYVVGRLKSTKSRINNIKKEFKNSISDLVPENPDNGLTANEMAKFNLDKARTDITGLTIVLKNADDTLHFDETDPKYAEVIALRKKRFENLTFIHNLENFINHKEAFDFTKEDILQLQIDLLMRLRDSTYEECAYEYNGTSFKKLLKTAINKYEEVIKDETAQEEATENEFDDVLKYLEELKIRAHDKYQDKLLELFLPQILDDPLIKDVLNVSYSFAKKTIKPNGFVARYYYLITPEKRIIELQAITDKRFKDSRSGPSDHSSLPNKEIDITHFFEPSNPNISEKDFKAMIKSLNDTFIAEKNLLFEKPDSMLSSQEIRQKRRLKNAYNNIKIKDTVDGVPLEIALLSFAKYHSPRSFSASSPHTRVNNSVANYVQKSLLSDFAGVLLKHDQTSCLARLLIDKFGELTENNKNEVSINGIKERQAKREARRNQTTLSTLTDDETNEKTFE